MKVVALKSLGISGSLRSGSKNSAALAVAMDIAQSAGADVELLNLRDLNIPIYDQDMEDKGMPEGVKTLRGKIEGADVLIIASPEYNGSVSGALKNAIDWASRGENSLNGKVVAIFGASPGGFGTIEGQKHLRDILAKLNCFVLPQPRVLISNSDKVFSENGDIIDDAVKKKLIDLITKTIEFAKKIK